MSLWSKISTGLSAIPYVGSFVAAGSSIYSQSNPYSRSTKPASVQIAGATTNVATAQRQLNNAQTKLAKIQSSGNAKPAQIASATTAVSDATINLKSLSDVLTQMQNAASGIDTTNFNTITNPLGASAGTSTLSTTGAIPTAANNNTPVFLILAIIIIIGLIFTHKKLK